MSNKKLARDQILFTRDRILMTREQEEAGVWSNFDDARAFLPLSWSNFDDTRAFLPLAWSNFDDVETIRKYPSVKEEVSRS